MQTTFAARSRDLAARDSAGRPRLGWRPALFRIGVGSVDAVSDRPRKSGTARDALAQPNFRRIYLASFVSNTGRWMQNTALGVLAWELT